MNAIAKRIGPHAHLVANMTENVGRPLLTTDELYQMGFNLITYPITLILTATAAMTRVMRELQEKGTTRAVADQIMPVGEFREIVRFSEFLDFEKQLSQTDNA